MRPFYLKFLPVFFIFCLGLVVYSDIFFNSFHFDDFPEIVNNASIQNIHCFQDIWSFWPTRFMAGLSFALNFYWGKLNVVGYHVFSLLIHLGSSIMVWWLMILTLGLPSVKNEKISAHAGWIAFFTALIFLVHPLQTQPVNYIYQRATLLAAFFYLSSLGLYVKARSIYLSNSDAVGWKAYFIGALFSAVLCMFSKELAISLPLMFCFYEFCFLKNEGKRSWPWLMPFFLIALLLPLTWLVTHPDILKGTKQVLENYAGGVSMKRYFLTQTRVMVTYLRLLFVPIHQTIEYDFPLTNSISEIPFILSSLFLLFAHIYGGEYF